MFERIILNQVKQDKNTIYGARSIIKQTPAPYFRRTTKDWDIFSITPKKSATKLHNKLERIEPGDQAMILPAKHPGTHHVYYNKKAVADFTKQPKTLRFISIDDIRYSRLEDEAKRKNRALKYKKYAFRYGKDLNDLSIIQIQQSIGRFKGL
jgi:hypothetical protein